MRLRICNAQVGLSFLQIEQSPVYRPYVGCPGVILRGWSQSSNCVAHIEEMPEHEENCYPLGSTSTYCSTEMAPLWTGCHPSGEIQHRRRYIFKAYCTTDKKWAQDY
ncbi:hypothetical protein TNCT_715541 [Trichonephila clavata]|uniref:Uncharacterized protein n=1 Tax=Trichonephila clavata TaxID=2740835 RepID=A0A8X6FFV7_TRICU|nr:hypothetical protein TNCT_715541 [Trichonephila clavata]